MIDDKSTDELTTDIKFADFEAALNATQYHPELTLAEIKEAFNKLEEIEWPSEWP